MKHYQRQFFSNNLPVYQPDTPYRYGDWGAAETSTQDLQVGAMMNANNRFADIRPFLPQPINDSGKYDYVNYKNNASHAWNVFLIGLFVGTTYILTQS